MPREWQTWKNNVSESNVASDWWKMLWKLVKCWELLLDIKQWEEHKFAVGFPSSKLCDLFWKCQLLVTSIDEQNRYRCGSSKGNFTWKQESHVGNFIQVSSEHFERNLNMSDCYKIRAPPAEWNFLCPKLMMALKGRRFNDMIIIKQKYEMHLPTFELCTSRSALNSGTITKLII